MNDDLKRAEAAEAEAKRQQAIADDTTKTDAQRAEARHHATRQTMQAAYYREQAAK